MNDVVVSILGGVYLSPFVLYYPLMNSVDVLIIGAGAAGLMCAIQAGGRRRNVLVIDHANKAGKKILMSGGGRCNFTNLDVGPQHFISHNPHFCRSAVSRYTPTDFIALVEKHHIPYHEKTLGQLFCDNKSKDILMMLLAECEAVAAAIELNTAIISIKHCEQGGFEVATSMGNINCESLVIATGGLSIPTMGATPFGYKLATQFGINVYPTRAGLVPFTLHEKDKQLSHELSGVAVDCTVSCNNQQFSEAMLFTHRGLSGPAMLQISSYWNPGDELVINLLPTHDLFEILKEQQLQHPQQRIKTILNQLLPKRMVALWFAEQLLELKLADCAYQKFKHISDTINHWHVKPNGTEGYRTAEVTLGGVDCNAVSSKTFAANTVPGLYFIGEVLDVTGWLGGYNFQWAWASGHAAGQVV